MLFGKCVYPGDMWPGGNPGVTPAGNGNGGQYALTMGLYGEGRVPLREQRSVSKCPPGYVLGKDGVCYDSLPKSKRKWNPGTKPLGTSGEMHAVAVANRFAGRLTRTKKRLKKVGKALEKC